jgi:hypothetical protein
MKRNTLSRNFYKPKIVALILEKGSDGKFVAESTSWIENRVFLPADLLGVSRMLAGRLGDEEGFPGGPAIADRYASRPQGGEARYALRTR